MPKQNAQSKPPHRPARRKSKPKFDVPAGVGEPSSASWVYREDAPESTVTSPDPPPTAAIAEAIAKPIAAAIEATAAVEPEQLRPAAPREEPIADAFATPMYEST